MRKVGPQGWLSLLCGGIGVAIFAFVAPKVWDFVAFKELKPDYVKASLRRDGDNVVVFVRNLSDEALDLTKARIVITGLEPGATRLGAYPEVSKLYVIDATTGAATVERVEKDLVAMIRITQAIEPGDKDQFSFTLSDRVGAVNLAGAAIKGELFDIEGNAYRIDSE